MAIVVRRAQVYSYVSLLLLFSSPAAWVGGGKSRLLSYNTIGGRKNQKALTIPQRPTLFSFRYIVCCFESVPKSGYTKDFTLIGSKDGIDQATYMASTSSYVVEGGAPDSSFPVIAYKRSSTEEFDLIYYDTTAITNANEYVTGKRKFYMDVFRSSTSRDFERCTRVLLQLDSTTTEEFPIGRHSRYVAFMTESNVWERLDFVFLDQPDVSVDDSTITALVLFFNPGVTGDDNDDTYFFRNVDSAANGCYMDGSDGGEGISRTSSSECERMVPKSCPAFFQVKVEVMKFVLMEKIMISMVSLIVWIPIVCWNRFVEIPFHEVMHLQPSLKRRIVVVAIRRRRVVVQSLHCPSRWKGSGRVSWS